MERTFYTLVLVAVSIVLGMVIGETYAPINGNTINALSSRTAALERRIEMLSTEFEALKVEVTALTSGTPDAGR